MAEFISNIANHAVYVIAEQTGAVNEGTGAMDIIKGGTGRIIGYSTGIEAEENNITYWEILRNNSLFLIPSQDIALSEKSYDEDIVYKADRELQTLLELQKDIAYQISIASLLVAELKGKHDITKQETALKYYYRRFKDRNELIRLYSQNITDSNIAQLDNSLDRAGIGVVVSTGILIIISCVVTASFASLAWYTYYNENSQSRTDARDLIALNKALADVDPSVREKVFKIVNQYGDENYRKGARKILLQNITGKLKYIAIFAVGLLGIHVYLKNR